MWTSQNDGAMSPRKPHSTGEMLGRGPKASGPTVCQVFGREVHIGHDRVSAGSRSNRKRAHSDKQTGDTSDASVSRPPVSHHISTNWRSAVVDLLTWFAVVLPIAALALLFYFLIVRTLPSATFEGESVLHQAYAARAGRDEAGRLWLTATRVIYRPPFGSTITLARSEITGAWTFRRYFLIPDGLAIQLASERRPHRFAVWWPSVWVDKIKRGAQASQA